MRNERPRMRQEKPRDEFDSVLLGLSRVTKVTAGGKNLRFRAVIIAGNKAGKVGLGVAKGLDVAQAVEKAVGGERGRIHPATKTFQALRIAVNQELANLESALKQSVGLLEMEGRLAVISYHSLEDRIVKQFMQRETTDCVCPPETPTCFCGHKARIKLINKKVITPSAAEIQANPRSRSAKLRVAERIRAKRIA